VVSKLTLQYDGTEFMGWAPQPGMRTVCGELERALRTVLGEKDGLQSFTAVGRVRQGEVYEGAMGGGFTPARRDVDWCDAKEAPIKPQLDRLDFTAGRPNWGYQLRFGLFEISEHDFRLISEAMGAGSGRRFVEPSS